MDTDRIINLADPGKSASPDLDLALILRYKVIPEFLFDVRAASWRRKQTTISYDGTRYADAPSDLVSVRRVLIDEDNSLVYIGEDERKVLLALLDSTPAEPTGYWLDAPGIAARNRIVLDCVPASPVTYSLSYLMGIYWNEEQSLLLDQYIPVELQWGLVEGLKAELWRERAGVGDARYLSAANEYGQWKARALTMRELGRDGNYVKSVR